MVSWPISINSSPPTRWPCRQTFPDRAARQRQRDARRKIEADQEADIGKADAEFGAKQRCNRSDALKLERHREPHDEQDGQNTPAIAATLDSSAG